MSNAEANRAADATILPGHLPHYNKVLTLGDPSIRDLLVGRVVVQEKVDGSQFRFGMLDGRLMVGSHRVDYDDVRPPDTMFQPGWIHINAIVHSIPEGWVFYAEFLGSPRHNTLAYERIPKNHLMLFDAFDLLKGRWATQKELVAFADQFDIDPPRVIYSGLGETVLKEMFEEFLTNVSYLGNSLIKNYEQDSGDRYHQGPGFCCGKFVSRAFKEENRANWSSQSDIVTQIVDRFKTPTRWDKARQHLRDDGKLEGAMRDMRGLIDEVSRDIEEEMRPEIEKMLYDHFERQITKGILAGLAEWYKKLLAEGQFETPAYSTPSASKGVAGVLQSAPMEVAPPPDTTPAAPPVETVRSGQRSSDSAWRKMAHDIKENR